jgi:putative membrane protein
MPPITRAIRGEQNASPIAGGAAGFLVYFCTGVIAVLLYLFVYTRVTPHHEFKLIRDNVPAAAISLGLSLLGFVLPVVSAIVHSANVFDCLIWSVIALIVQMAVARSPTPLRDISRVDDVRQNSPHKVVSGRARACPAAAGMMMISRSFEKFR